MVSDMMWMGCPPLEYSLILKYPRQRGHTTAISKLFLKYNAWYLYDRVQMSRQFMDIISVRDSDRIFKLGSPHKIKGTTNIQPSLILIDNYTFMDDGEKKVSDFLENAIPTVKGGMKPVPIVCLG